MTFWKILTIKAILEVTLTKEIKIKDFFDFCEENFFVFIFVPFKLKRIFFCIEIKNRLILNYYKNNNEWNRL